MGFLLPDVPRAAPVGKLQSLEVTDSAYGNGIAVARGTIRLPGQLIQALPLREVEPEEDEDAGGKGFLAPDPDTGRSQYRYFASFAMAFAEAPAQRICRIIADTYQVFDDTVGFREGFNIRTYMGTEEQPVDALLKQQYEAADKSNRTPAYRGLTYAVFDDIPLEPFGNRIPQVFADIEFRTAPARKLVPVLTVQRGDTTDRIVSQPSPRLIEFSAVDPWRNTYYHIQQELRTHADAGAGGAQQGRQMTVTAADMASLKTLYKRDFQIPLNTTLEYLGFGYGSQLLTRLAGGGEAASIALVNLQSGTVRDRIPEASLQPFYVGFDNPYALAYGKNWIFLDKRLRTDGPVDVLPWDIYLEVSVFSFQRGAFALTRLPFTDSYTRVTNLTRGPEGIYLGIFLLDGTLTFRYPSMSLYQLQVVGDTLVANRIFSFTVDDLATAVAEYTSEDKKEYEPGFMEENHFLAFDTLTQRFYACLTVLPKGETDNALNRRGILVAINPDPDLDVKGVREPFIEAAIELPWSWVSIDTDPSPSAFNTKAPATQLEYGQLAIPRPGYYWTQVSGDIHPTRKFSHVEQEADLYIVSLSSMNVEPYKIQEPSYPPGHYQSPLYNVGYFSNSVTSDAPRQIFTDGRTWIEPPSGDGASGQQQQYVEKKQWQKLGLPPCGRHSIGLADLLYSICARVIPSPETVVDVSQIDNTIFVPGVYFDSSRTAQEQLRYILLLYRLGLRDTASGIQFYHKLPVLAPGLVTEDELVGEYSFARTSEAELPTQASLAFLDPTKAYAPSTAYSKRTQSVSPGVVPSSVETFDTTLAMGISDAQHLAEIYLYSRWVGRVELTVTLPPRYLTQEVGDRLRVTFNSGAVFEGRIVKQVLGANNALRTTIQQDEQGAFTVPSTATVSVPPAEAYGTIGASEPTLLNAPLLADEHEVSTAVFTSYTTAAPIRVSGSWGGARVYRSPDEDTWVTAGDVQSSAIWGYAVNALGDAPTNWLIDKESYLDVAMVAGGDRLSSVSRDKLFYDANPMLIEKLDGQIAVLQFQDVSVLPESGVYRFKNFVRGRRGTEDVDMSYTGGERVFFPTTASTLINRVGLDKRNAELFYSSVTRGSVFLDATPVAAKASGVDALPYAPVKLMAQRETNKDLTLSWTRRTRIGGNVDLGASTAGGHVPLGEVAEEYDLQIGQRNISKVNSSSYTYTLVQQEADGLTGDESTTAFSVWQLSARVGRGRPASYAGPVS